MSTRTRRPTAIKFLKKPSETEKQMLALSLAFAQISVHGEDGTTVLRPLSFEELEAALRAYFAAAPAAAAVEAPPLRVMRPAAAAAALGIAIVTVRLWMRQGKLRKVQLSPGAVGVCAEDVAAFIAKARGA